MPSCETCEDATTAKIVRSPETNSRFSTPVKIRMGTMGFKLRRISFTGIFATI